MFKAKILVIGPCEVSVCGVCVACVWGRRGGGGDQEVGTVRGNTASLPAVWQNLDFQLPGRGNR